MKILLVGDTGVNTAANQRLAVSLCDVPHWTVDWYP